MKKPKHIFIFKNIQSPSGMPLATIYDGNDLGTRLENAFQSSLKKTELQNIVVQKCKI